MTITVVITMENIIIHMFNVKNKAEPTKHTTKRIIQRIILSRVLLLELLRCEEFELICRGSVVPLGAE